MADEDNQLDLSSSDSAPVTLSLDNKGIAEPGAPTPPDLDLSKGTPTTSPGIDLDTNQGMPDDQYISNLVARGAQPKDLVNINPDLAYKMWSADPAGPKTWRDAMMDFAGSVLPGVDNEKFIPLLAARALKDAGQAGYAGVTNLAKIIRAADLGDQGITPQIAAEGQGAVQNFKGAALSFANDANHMISGTNSNILGWLAQAGIRKLDDPVTKEEAIASMKALNASDQSMQDIQKGNLPDAAKNAYASWFNKELSPETQEKVRSMFGSYTPDEMSNMKASPEDMQKLAMLPWFAVPGMDGLIPASIEGPLSEAMLKLSALPFRAAEKIIGASGSALDRTMYHAPLFYGLYRAFLHGDYDALKVGAGLSLAAPVVERLAGLAAETSGNIADFLKEAGTRAGLTPAESQTLKAIEAQTGGSPGFMSNALMNTAQGGVKGMIRMAPFTIGAQSPEEFSQTLGTGLGLGAGITAAHDTASGMALAARKAMFDSVVNTPNGTFIPLRADSLPTGDAALDNLHAQDTANWKPENVADLNRSRHLMQDVVAGIYSFPEGVFDNTFGQDIDGAHGVRLTTPQGDYIIYRGETGFENAKAHEPLHVVRDQLSNDEKSVLDKSLIANRDPSEFASEYYSDLTGSPVTVDFNKLPDKIADPKDPLGMTKEKVMSEMTVASLKNFDINKITADPGLRRKLQLGIGKALESIGIPTTTGEVSTIRGVTPSMTAISILENAIRRMAVKASDQGITYSGLSPMAAGAPAPTAPVPQGPAAPALALPEHATPDHPATNHIDPAIHFPVAVNALRAIGMKATDAKVRAEQAIEAARQLGMPVSSYDIVYHARTGRFPRETTQAAQAVVASPSQIPVSGQPEAPQNAPTGQPEPETGQGQALPEGLPNDLAKAWEQNFMQDRGSALGAKDWQFMPANEGFYSKLEKSIEDKMPDKASPEQIRGIIANNQVKKAELDWNSPLRDLLDQGRMLSKDEVLSAVRAGTPQVTEKVLHEKNTVTHEEESEPDEYGYAHVYDEESPETKYGPESEGGHTFNLPGGKNYREILLTLPEKGYKLPDGFKTFQARDSSWGVEFPDGNRVHGWPSEALAIKSQRNQMPQPDFRSSHFEEPNIVGHLRVDDRTTTDGRPMTFIQEAQSDWGQKGRIEGFQETPAKLEVFKAPDGWRIRNENGVANIAIYPDEASAVAQAEKQSRNQSTGVPDMPFKGEAWKRLLMRTAIKKAVEAGHDAVGWTTGEQQADRYDLSKQLNNVIATKLDSGKRWGIEAQDKNGRLVISGTFPPEKLPDVVGKELSDKIISEKGGERDPEIYGDNAARYSGLDLKVGGEGMKGFYDKELVNIANDIGKKYGAKVEDTELSFSKGGESRYIYGTEGKREINPNFQTKVHSLPITDALRSAVSEQGQPLFMPYHGGEPELTNLGNGLTPEEHARYLAIRSNPEPSTEEADEFSRLTDKINAHTDEEAKYRGANGLSFMPSNDKDAIDRAAIRRITPEKVFPAKNVSDSHFMIPNDYPDLKHDYFGMNGYKNYEDGFVDKNGNFLNREAALTRAQQIGQPVNSARKYEAELHSDDFNRMFMPAAGNAQKIAEDYVNKSGIGSILPSSGELVDVNRAKKIGKAYEVLPTVSQSQETKNSYAQFIKEVNDQYQHAVDSGMNFQFTNQDPYNNSAEMTDDVRNGNLRVFTGGSDHPYLGESTRDENGLTANDKFRAVHDLYGHASEGNQFGPQGEERAWIKHSAMFSPEARGAMTAETRGQNSWVNYGPHMWNEAGWRGDPNNPDYLPPQNRPFAEQKASLLPDQFNHPVSEQWGELYDSLTPKERLSVQERNISKVKDMFATLPSIEEGADQALKGQAKKTWYQDSAQAISNIFGPEADRFAALLAALSPQVDVETNLSNALKTWNEWLDMGRPTDREAVANIVANNITSEAKKGEKPALGAWTGNAWRALSAESPQGIQLSGPKVSSFAKNLSNDLNEVTNDRWMKYYSTGMRDQAFRARRQGGMGIKGFDYLAMNAHIRQVADYLTKTTGEKWTPAESQAAIWSYSKTIAEMAEAKGVTPQELLTGHGGVDKLPISDTVDFATLLNDPKYQAQVAKARSASQGNIRQEPEISGLGEAQIPEGTSGIGNEINHPF